MFIDIHEVQKGETFKSIWQNGNILESRPLELATMNGLKYDDPLIPGQLLKVIKKGIYEPKKYLFLESEKIPKKSSIKR